MWLVKVLKPFVDFCYDVHLGVYEKQIGRVVNTVGMAMWIVMIPVGLFFFAPFAVGLLIYGFIGLFVMVYCKMKDGRI